MQSKPRDSFVLVALFAIGAASAAGYSHVTRSGPVRLAVTGAAHPLSPVADASRPPDAPDSNPRKRAGPIQALAPARSADPISVLEKAVDTNDEPEWRAALSSFRTQAQNQGDADERIRNVLRETISHTSNEALILAAQETLDGIEQDLIAAAQGSSP